MFNKNRKYSHLPILINIAVTAAAFAVCVILITAGGVDPQTAALACGAAALVACVGVWLGYRFFAINTRVAPDGMTPALGNMTLDLMLRFDLPVLILDENARIVWYNRSFTDRAGARTVLYGKRFEKFCPVPLEKIVADSEDGAGSDAEAFGSHFTVKAYPTKVEDSSFTITVWQDTSELVRMRRLIEDEDTVVAYITIDNLDELMQYAQEKYRSSAAEVENVLKQWADSSDGIFKEYERDRFIFLFASKHLESFIEARFDVLDRVREVRVGEGSLPITVSVGISQLGSTLAEKEKNAHTALDMALQRGGDQVVVRLQGDNLVFGGRIRTAQKRTKVRARVFAEQLTGMISSASNVLVMAHMRPDFDAIGSSVGIACLCRYCGVPVNVICDPESPDFIKCRGHLDPLPEYSEGVFVDRAEAQDLLQSGTLMVICDVNNVTQFQAPDAVRCAPTVVIIDHHRKSDDQGCEPAVSYIEPAASSTSEMVAEVLEHCLPTGTLKREEADLLLAGIMLDTKQFMRNTGSRTFGAALYLRTEGASPTLAQELFRTGLDDLISEANFESNVIIYRGCLAIANGEAGSAGDAARVAAAKAADKLLGVENVTASFVVCAIDDTVHISARSDGDVNVQLILEKLGGGGHFDSAATQLRDVTVKEALESLRRAIDEYMDEKN